MSNATRQTAFSFSRIAIYATLLLVGAVYLIPLVVMLLTSLQIPGRHPHRQPAELAAP